MKPKNDLNRFLCISCKKNVATRCVLCERQQTTKEIFKDLVLAGCIVDEFHFKKIKQKYLGDKE